MTNALRFVRMMKIYSSVRSTLAIFSQGMSPLCWRVTLNFVLKQMKSEAIAFHDGIVPVRHRHYDLEPESFSVVSESLIQISDRKFRRDSHQSRCRGTHAAHRGLSLQRYFCSRG